jgi:hypothetical protein
MEWSLAEFRESWTAAKPLPAARMMPTPTPAAVKPTLPNNLRTVFIE